MALSFASLKASKNRLPFRAHNIFIDGGKAAGQSLAFTTAPAADTYLYLVASGGADTAVYTAGEVVIELWGYRA